MPPELANTIADMSDAVAPQGCKPRARLIWTLRSFTRRKNCVLAPRNGNNFVRSNRVHGATLDNDPAHLQLRLDGSNSQNTEKPFIILLRRGGQLRCIAPLYIKQCPYRLRVGDAVLGSLPTFQARMIMLVGGRGEIIFAADETSARLHASIVDALWQHRSLFDMVCLENLDTASPLWNYCRESGGSQFRSYVASSSKVLQIQMPSNYEDYLKTLRPKKRYNLRRDARKLESEHQARFEKITEADQVRSFLDQFEQVYRRSWQGNLHTGRSWNTEPQIARLCRIAQLGWLRSYILKTSEGPIAAVFGCQYEGVYHVRELCFDPKWAESGPGSVLMHLLIEDLYQQNPPQVLDFGPGDEAYKRSFRSNVEQDVAFLYLLPPNRWRLLFEAQEKMKVVYPRVRSWMISSRLDGAGRKVAKACVAIVGAPIRLSRKLRGCATTNLNAVLFHDHSCL